MAFRGWEKKSLTLPTGETVQASCPVIVSASRSTDIPAFFPKWFSNRLRAGYMRWKNPFNASQVDYISFLETRAIVFWSKNPRPLLPYLPEIDARGINYYFQFTINDYENERFEPNVPPLSARVETFQILSEKLGEQRVIWRFDPLILTDRVDVPCLLDKIASVAERIRPYTKRLVISFADITTYTKVRNNLQREGIVFRDFTPDLMLQLAEGLNRMNHGWGLHLATCAEGLDLEQFGIEHNRCIDDRLMVDIFRHDSKLMQFLGVEDDLFSVDTRPVMKDKGQRKECGCIVSKDIGAYDTCNHLCVYCYANTSQRSVESNLRRHDPDEDMLLGAR